MTWVSGLRCHQSPDYSTGMSSLKSSDGNFCSYVKSEMVVKSADQPPNQSEYERPCAVESDNSAMESIASRASPSHVTFVILSKQTAQQDVIQQACIGLARKLRSCSLMHALQAQRFWPQSPHFMVFQMNGLRGFVWWSRFAMYGVSIYMVWCVILTLGTRCQGYVHPHCNRAW